MENNVIDARFIFTAKREVVHMSLLAGTLQRACPMGGTVERFPVGMAYADTAAAIMATDEDWSWLEEFK